MRLSVVLAHSDDDVDAANLAPIGRVGKRSDRDRIARNIHEGAGIFVKEVMVVGGIRIEIGATGIDHQLAQQSRVDELMECIIDRRQRDFYAGAQGLFVQEFGRDVPVAVTKQKFGERLSLARRAQIDRAQ